MAEFNPPLPNAQPLPAADVTAEPQSNNIEYQAFAVRKPEEDLSDFKIQVRASVLAKCRNRLLGMTKQKFPWYEVALGGGTLSAGGYLGALPANLPAASGQHFFFYTILPALSVGSLVAYFFLRHKAHGEPMVMASEVLAELPDPQRTR